MAQAELQKEFTFPAGGIADFYKDDEELAAMDREDAQRAFGNNGIANFQDVATRMASYGRYGDDKLVHAETGELIVPKALIEDNPKLRDSIFGHLRDMGIEDPERYVVGSGANSINPDTGLPEFFFKKIFKKVSKAIKKVSKKVVKVVKKAAPVIIPFALNAIFPGLGAIYSGALGSGIGTLVQGGSLKDAMKNALIGGAIGGATAGISGGLNAAPGQTFSQGAVTGIKKAASLSNLTTAGQQLATGQFGQAGLDAVNMSPDAFGTYGSGGEQYMASAPTSTSDVVSQATDISQPYGGGIQNEMVGGPRAFAPETPFTASTSTPTISSDTGVSSPFNDSAFTKANFSNVTTGDVAAADAANLSFDDANLFAGPDPALANVQLDPVLTGDGTNLVDTFKDYGSKASDLLFGKAATPADVAAAQGEAYKTAFDAALPTGGQAAAEAAGLKAMEGVTASSVGPGFMRKVLPSVALAGGATYLAGGFDAPEVEEPDLGPTGADMLRLTPYEYLIGQQNLRTRGSQGPVVVASQYAAEGGEIFPRRVGGIMPDEGVPGKDSVRAMLMPGEFVMTTDAVKGLGNGNNDQGINNMYQMMRGLEAKGRAMA